MAQFERRLGVFSVERTFDCDLIGPEFAQECLDPLVNSEEALGDRDFLPI